MLKTGRLNQNHLQKTYKLTDEAYEFLLLVQNYRCAICKRPEAEIEDRRVGRPRDDKSTSAKKLRKLVVDHDHATGEIRGLLCHYCNIGLGSFWDSPERLKNAAFYLQNHQTVQQMQGKQGEKSDGEL